MDERLLGLYTTELRHLRETAAEFGRDHPKIAQRLLLDVDGKDACADPYVERLLEGFAFLAARVHLKLDAEFPRFTQGILETVYPDYLCPVPSMAMVKFSPEEQEESLAAGVTIKRGTLLRSQLGKGERTACTFRTAHDVRLLPVKITDATYFTQRLAELNLPPELKAKAALRLRLKKTIPNSFAEIRLDPFSVYLRGPDQIPSEIYEQIFAHKTRLIVQAPGTRGRVLASRSPDCIRRCGYAPEQALLPTAPQGFEGYRLLKEYFSFPQRFLFCEFAGFGDALAQVKGEEVDLIVVLDAADTGLEGQVDASCFELFCTPTINLFEKTLDRINISGRVSEFHVVPDRHRALDFEIYRISSLMGHGDTPDQDREFLPFYKARDMDLDARAFYTTNRVQRLFSDRERLTGRRTSYAGTDLFISIVDGDMAPYSPNLRQLGVKALCTNRHLPIQMFKNTMREETAEERDKPKRPADEELRTNDFTMELSAPVSSIRILQGPTVPRPSLVLTGQNQETGKAGSSQKSGSPVPSGRFAWRVISHLSLNYLSLLDGSESGAEGLREVLRLYADPQDRQMSKQIDGLRNVRHKAVFRRVETPGPITFARGLEITLMFDESAFEGQGVFVLGAVLEQFFTRHVALNSFTETVITTQQRKEIMRWSPQMGRRQIL